MPVSLSEVPLPFGSVSLGLADGETEVAASAGFASSLVPQAARPETSVNVRAAAIALRFRSVMVSPLRHVFLFRT